MADPPFRGRWSKRHDELARASGFDSWESWIAAIEKEKKGKKICGGKAQIGPCRRLAGWGSGHAGRGRCRRHDGPPTASPRDVLIAEQEERSDVDLASVRDQALLARALQAMLFEELETAGPFTFIVRFREAQATLEGGNLEEAGVMALRLFESAGTVVELYDRIEASMDLIRRLTKSEHEILKLRHDMVSRRQLANLMGRVSRALRQALERNIPDDRVQQATMLDFVGALQDVYGDPETVEIGPAAN